MKGTVFDIQRFSVHDGPGVRTTVFMKGCPLQCLWCHNPEGLSPKAQIRFYEEKCIGCQNCKGMKTAGNAEKCPSGAIELCGREYGAYELLEEILKDRVFYTEGGGVTFSGGECLMQADFVAEVLKLAKGEGLHTVIDTCGYAPREAFEKTCGLCDLYLYDIKCIDPVLHKRYTGMDNGLILDNLKWICSVGVELIVRVPVIPEFNDSKEQMEIIADFVSSLHRGVRVELIPYHTLGISKYKPLGLEYTYGAKKPVEKDRVRQFGKTFTDMGITVL